MSTVSKYIPQYTVADYAQWEGEWELWDGIAVSMAPGPFGRHQRVDRLLMRKLEDAIVDASCQAEVSYELD